MGGPVRGAYYHFRCDRHAVEGHSRVSNHPDYRCDVRGCERAAKAYWYEGEKFATLTMDVKPEFWIYG